MNPGKRSTHSVKLQFLCYSKYTSSKPVNKFNMDIIYKFDKIKISGNGSTCSFFCEIR